MKDWQTKTTNWREKKINLSKRNLEIFDIREESRNFDQRNQCLNKRIGSNILQTTKWTCYCRQVDGNERTRKITNFFYKWNIACDQFDRYHCWSISHHEQAVIFDERESFFTTYIRWYGRKWGGALTKHQIEKAGFGIFLFVAKCKVNLKHRERIYALKDLISKTESTISVVVPGYEHRKVESLSIELKNKKHQNVCKLFARLEYKMVPRKGNHNCWYLLDSKFTYKTKEEELN